MLFDICNVLTPDDHADAAEPVAQQLTIIGSICGTSFYGDALGGWTPDNNFGAPLKAASMSFLLQALPLDFASARIDFGTGLDTISQIEQSAFDAAAAAAPGEPLVTRSIVDPVRRTMKFKHKLFEVSDIHHVFLHAFICSSYATRSQRGPTLKRIPMVRCFSSSDFVCLVY